MPAALGEIIGDTLQVTEYARQCLKLFEDKEYDQMLEIFLVMQSKLQTNASFLHQVLLASGKESP